MNIRWIVCQDRGKYVVVKVHGRETKKQFIVLEKDNQEQWPLIASCLGHRTRLDKDDERLFNSKSDAISQTIAKLDASRMEHQRRVEEITEEILGLFKLKLAD